MAPRSLWLIVFLLSLALTKQQQQVEVTTEGIAAAAAAGAETAPVVNHIVNEIVYTIEHSLTLPNSFSHRTTIKHVTRADGKQSWVYPERNSISQDFVEDFKALLVNNGLYKIRVRSSAGDASHPWLVKSIPACTLQKSGFKEDLSIYIDDAQNVFGATYHSPAPISKFRTCDPSLMRNTTNLQTRLKFGEDFAAMQIPIQAVGVRPNYIPKEMKLEKGAEHTSTTTPPTTSFLQKYWYIVVFLVLYLLSLPVADDKKKGGAEGAATAAAPAS